MKSVASREAAFDTTCRQISINEKEAFLCFIFNWFSIAYCVGSHRRSSWAKIKQQQRDFQTFDTDSCRMFLCRSTRCEHVPIMWMYADSRGHICCRCNWLFWESVFFIFYFLLIFPFSNLFLFHFLYACATYCVYVCKYLGDCIYVKVDRER